MICLYAKAASSVGPYRRHRHLNGSVLSRTVLIFFSPPGQFDTHFIRWASKHGPNCLIYYVKLVLSRISGQIVTTEPCKSCVFVQLTAICKIESQNQSLSSASYFDSLAVFILIKKLLYKTF